MLLENRLGSSTEPRTHRKGQGPQSQPLSLGLVESRDGLGGWLWGGAAGGRQPPWPLCGLQSGGSKDPREDRSSPPLTCPPLHYTRRGRGTLESPALGQQVPWPLAQPSHHPGAKLQHPLPGTCFPQWAPQTQASSPPCPAPLQSGWEDGHRRAGRAACARDACQVGLVKTAHLF